MGKTATIENNSLLAVHNLTSHSINIYELAILASDLLHRIDKYKISFSHIKTDGYIYAHL